MTLFQRKYDESSTGITQVDYSKENRDLLGLKHFSLKVSLIFFGLKCYTKEILKGVQEHLFELEKGDYVWGVNSLSFLYRGTDHFLFIEYDSIY